MTTCHLITSRQRWRRHCRQCYCEIKLWHLVNEGAHAGENEKKRVHASFHFFFSCLIIWLGETYSADRYNFHSYAREHTSRVFNCVQIEEIDLVFIVFVLDDATRIEWFFSGLKRNWARVKNSASVRVVICGKQFVFDLYAIFLVVVNRNRVSSTELEGNRL